MLSTAVSPSQKQTRPPRLVPVLVGCFALAAGFAGLILWTLQSVGRWVYPLDDAYIGMSIAKHLDIYGIWGTSHQFASATSTPGFVTLLAICYSIAGVNQYTPLVLNLLFCIGVVLITARLLRHATTHFQIAGVLLVTILTPLWTMAALGMEHALQILLCLLFLDLWSPVVAFDQPITWKALVVCSLMVSVRYEGLFLAAGTCLLLILRRRWPAAFALVGFAWLPVLGFGLYFRLHGAEWLPNSILLKGGAGLHRIGGFLLGGLHMVPLMLLATLLMAKHPRPRSRGQATIWITGTALWLHFFLADYGWVYRYEAYLIALGIAGLMLCYAEGDLSTGMRPWFWLAVGCLAVHAFLATTTLPARSRAIYQQQMQTAKLLTIYPTSAALNDIGAPTYFPNSPVLDLVGLGSQDVFRARYKRPYTTQALHSLLDAHHVQTIVIYDKWFSPNPPFKWCGPPLPSGYVRVATLHTPAPKGYLGDNTVTYYAAPGTEATLRSALRELQPDLPVGDSLSF